jgi:hypothetical protein
MAKQWAVMPMNDCMCGWVQLFGYLEKGLLQTTMGLPTKQEQIKEIFTWCQRSINRSMRRPTRLSQTIISLLSAFLAVPEYWSYTQCTQPTQERQT